MYTHSSARNVKHVRCCRRAVLAESALRYVDGTVESLLLASVSCRMRRQRPAFASCDDTRFDKVFPRWTLADALIFDYLKPAYTPGSMGVYPPISKFEMCYNRGICLIDFFYFLRLDGLSPRWLIAARLPSGRAVCLGRTSTASVHSTHTADARMSVHLRTTDVNGLHRPIPT